MLHRNTNRLTLILIYTVLEWILINNPPPPQHPAPGVVASTTSSIPRRTRISSEISSVNPTLERFPSWVTAPILRNYPNHRQRDLLVSK
ncbi:hypothetical protein RHGRI_029325 [Rhododendron griersonianum]|uniref:Secreted protein n=1 Tax=Rhododendron griersonianum TaxID=479676 RepID=A0AAV6IL53_9ERIC|nr:hypothetical protein RHGRI_029325 [Rhododendron griersonianum]